MDPPAGSACQLARRDRGSFDHRGDLLERDREHVVEHERQSFGRLERFEDDEQRQAHRIGHLGVPGRIVGGHGFSRRRGRTRDRRHDRLGQPGPRVLLAAGPAGAEHVEADAADDDRQPAPKIARASRVVAVEPDPALLDGVLGLRQRAEHPVGDRAEMRPLPLEFLGQPFPAVHLVGASCYLAVHRF